MQIKREKKSLRFTDKRVSGLGIGATVMGTIGWIVFAAISIYSASMDGKAELFIGGIGLLDAVLSMVGMIVSYRALQERDIYYVMPIIGMALNGILFVVYFSLDFQWIFNDFQWMRKSKENNQKDEEMANPSVFSQ